MSTLIRSNLSHIYLSVNRYIKIIVICEVHRMIFARVEVIYDPSSSCYGLIDNYLSPEISHRICFMKNWSQMDPTLAPSLSCQCEVLIHPHIDLTWSY